MPSILATPFATTVSGSDLRFEEPRLEFALAFHFDRASRLQDILTGYGRACPSGNSLRLAAIWAVSQERVADLAAEELLLVVTSLTRSVVFE
jgi:hypothetical protein